MPPPEHPHATPPSPSAGRPPVPGGAVSRIDRLRRSGVAWRSAAGLGALVLAGLIVLALSGIGFAGIGWSLSHVHRWWLMAALALNRLSMFLRALSSAALALAPPPAV